MIKTPCTLIYLTGKCNLAMLLCSLKVGIRMEKVKLWYVVYKRPEWL